MSSFAQSRIESITAGHFPKEVIRNAAPARLYQDAVLFDEAQITSSGGVATKSGEKTGRSPKDKRIVEQDSITNDVWWGDINIPFSEESFALNRQRAVEFLDSCERLYVLDAFAGWDPDNQLKIRIICSRAYHALFVHNMLIRPTEKQLADFGEPDYTIFNAGQTTADESVEGVSLSLIHI